MTVVNSDGTMAVSDVDDADVFAGAAPIPGDPMLMGQLIQDVLSDPGRTAAR
jgi:hypothetical protein